MMSDPSSSSGKGGNNKLAEALTQEEVEAWNMWIYKTHGIMPNQYHHFYDQGDTLLFNEHIQDLLVIDKIWANKQEKEAHKQRSRNPKNNPLARQKNSGLGGGGFYGQTYRYDK